MLRRVIDYSITALLHFAHKNRRFHGNKRLRIAKILDQRMEKILPYPLFRREANVFPPPDAKDIILAVPLFYVRLVLQTLLLFPIVLQARGAIEDKMVCGRIGVHHEVSLLEELVVVTLRYSFITNGCMHLFA